MASDGVAEDTLWANVVTYMWASKHAVVLMDSADGVAQLERTDRDWWHARDWSEVRHPPRQECPAMPSDLVGHIYKPTDLSDHDSSLAEIHKWIRDDLGLSECDRCPTAA